MENHIMDGANGSHVKQVLSPMAAAPAAAGGMNRSRLKGPEMVLRLLSFCLAFTATIMVGVDKQTKNVAMSLIPTLPPLIIPVVAKWHYLSAFVYFVVANAIACAYAAISFVLLLTNPKRTLSLLIFIGDLVMVALLFSGAGAAMAVGLIGYQGNSHVEWKKVCDVFGKFCSKIALAWAISFLGCIVFFMLVLLTTLKLHNNKV